ncbi:hypothetical protein Godav_019390 [Gossypium davidsonii]|uniref:Zinc knuckle CX2CX4HX4C domain-containing protein n=2 Tax=Gossypium TaxID=3633 RepID=A0A7J8R0Y9_GOSDV|nr:hypothetical protein [Gossypium davidsonii]MBA0641977.1 hypothetical protein [Gossypium klotzschianum]
MEHVLADLHLEDEEASENEGWQVDQETVEGEIVQIHDLPKGMHFESVAKQFCNFIGTFLDYDEKAMAAGLKNYIRIRVEIDIRKLIKRRKKLIIGNGNEHFVSFKYEKLTTFCFLCGKLGRGESFCPIRIIHGKELPLG